MSSKVYNSAVDPDRAIGITSMVPVEMIYGAGLVPLDLNNVFVTSPDAPDLVLRAEREGLPRNLCAWIKGMYSAARSAGIGRMIAIRRGDCSEGETLADLLTIQGVESAQFAFPARRDRKSLRREMEEAAAELGASWRQVEEAFERLDRPRRLARRLDEMTWRQDNVGGEENHLTLLSCSDFAGDPEGFADRLENRLAELEAAPADSSKLRLAFVGVPPIFTDLHSFLADRGARIVLNEVQRQFSLPSEGDILDRYLAYTYPYGIRARLADISAEIEQRRVRGIIHYVQSFCHHSLETRFIARLGLPVLTLEGDRPGLLDARSRLRLEAFLEVLEAA